MPRVVKLSVIVPFFNVQRYVPDALRSLQANADPDFEFILVDDCSTDETPGLLERGLKDLPGARLVRHERNGGLARARNTGIDTARGEYLTFMDGDDWLSPGYLAQLVKAMDDLQVDFLRTDHIKSTGTERTVVRAPHGRRNAVLDPRECILPADRPSLIDYPNVPFGAYHRRTVDMGLLRQPEQLRTAEDRLWAWGMHLGTSSIGVVGLMGMHYRRDVTTSLTAIGDERQLDFVRCCEEIFALLAKDRDGERFLPKAVRQFCALIAFHLDRIDRFEPALARRLKSICAAALGRVPSDVLNAVLDSMDLERSTKIRRLRWRLPARSELPDTGQPPAPAGAADQAARAGESAAAGGSDDDLDAGDTNGSAVA